VNRLLRAHYHAPIGRFIGTPREAIVGTLAHASGFSVEPAQLAAWGEQVDLLQQTLAPYVERGDVFFEFVLPRLGRRIDVVLVLDQWLVVIEFKVGEKSFSSAAIDQVWDYALDLKSFHETSHHLPIVPLLIATRARESSINVERAGTDGVYPPSLIGARELPEILRRLLVQSVREPIRIDDWAAGRYSPTPTILEAARALWSGHTVAEISRSDAGATNLTRTASYIDAVISAARHSGQKVVCLLTGVPGAGKTLVGLGVAARHINKDSPLHSVFLSGNGPLVAILREALARDRVEQERQAGRVLRKGAARSQVESFIQNVHHFRDECLLDPSPPSEHVAIFDEAQRAWNREQTASFMSRKKGRADFDASEPEFLLSCMDRHPDWAVVLCLVGGGQEINTGEAGIAGWVEALQTRFQDWAVHLSPRLQDTEYDSGAAMERLRGRPAVFQAEDLHLKVSMRSFRAERVSDWVKYVLDQEIALARHSLAEVLPRFPIVLTRRLSQAKDWLRNRARGSERFGIVVSSQAQRLKPHAIDVRAPVDPVHWFLDSRDDVRSSYYLEDAATEFHVQGLELDWTCVVWDADLRNAGLGWDHWEFRGSRWQRIRSADRQLFLKNAYRVLLTRARQGMVIVVPEGDERDRTREASFYDSTYEYLVSLGVPTLS
jgi:hypothetical protein